jgi:hypothetical protein
MSDMVRTSEVATAVAAALLGAGAELEATRPEAEVEVPPLEGFRTQEETEAPRRKFDYGEHFGSMDHPEDFEPSKLLNNHIWAGELRRRLDETEPEVEIGYVYVTTPKGGSEYRPLARFDKLPSNPRHFVRRKSVKGTVFDAVCLEEESVAGESESTLPPRRLMPLDPKRSWAASPSAASSAGRPPCPGSTILRRAPRRRPRRPFPKRRRLRRLRRAPMKRPPPSRWSGFACSGTRTRGFRSTSGPSSSGARPTSS